MREINLLVRDWFIHLNDIVVSLTIEDNLEPLEAAALRHQSQKLKLNASKCEFVKSSATYLGHLLSEANVYEPQQNLRWGCCNVKPFRFKPLVIYYWPF